MGTGWVVTAIACGREHAAALAVAASPTADDARTRLLTWGDNQRGQLGRRVGEGEGAQQEGETETEEEEEEECGVTPGVVWLPGANPTQVRGSRVAVFVMLRC